MFEIRKLLVLLLACCVALSGCSARSAREPKRNARYHLTLALRSGTYSTVIESCLADFEEKNDCACEVVAFSEDELHGAVLGQDGTYDLCMVDGSWVAECLAKGALANLSEMGYELDGDVIPATTAICYDDGDVYLAPYYGNVTVLLYNKALARIAGYGSEDIRSLSDVMAICEKARKQGSMGFMYRGDTPNDVVVDFLPILLSFGGWVVDGNNRPTVNTDEFKRALGFYLKLIGTGTAVGKDDLVMAVANRAAAVGIGWPGWYLPGEKSSADYVALTGRVESGGKAYNANVYGVWCIGVCEGSEDKKMAVKLLSYLMDPEVQKATVDFGGVPCRYSSLADDEVQRKYPQYAAVLSALENGVYRPEMRDWTTFYTILGGYLKRIMDGEVDMDKGLEAAQAELARKVEK